jgi:hypothetical protein
MRFFDLDLLTAETQRALRKDSSYIHEGVGDWILKRADLITVFLRTINP